MAIKVDLGKGNQIIRSFTDIESISGLLSLPLLSLESHRLTE